MEFITQLALIISVGVISGLIAIRMKMPILVGYIFGGAVLSLLVSFSPEDLHTINNFAEVGVALLLFTIGIEFSVDKLMSVKKYAIYGGAIQILLTIVLGIAIFHC